MKKISILALCFVGFVAGSALAESSKKSSKKVSQRQVDKMKQAIVDRKTPELEELIKDLTPDQVRSITVSKNYESESLLILAVLVGNLNAVRVLLEAGADINAKTVKHKNTVFELVNPRVDMDDDDDETYVWFLGSFEEHPMTRLLLKYGSMSPEEFSRAKKLYNERKQDMDVIGGERKVTEDGLFLYEHFEEY